MHNCSEDNEYQEIKKVLLRELDIQVNHNDGYVPWQELLENYKLEEQREESEKFFRVILKNFYKKMGRETG